MKRLVFAIIIIGLVGLLGWQVFDKVTAEKKDFSRGRRAPQVAVETTSIRRGTIRDIGHFAGSLYPASEIMMAPKISGRLEKLHVDIGDRVTADQLLAVLDDEEHRQQISQARAEMEVARANLMERQNTLDNALKEYERTVVLRDKKIVSESQLDGAQSQVKNQEAKLKVAQAQVSQKEALLKTAEVRLSYTRIRVPPNSSGGHQVVGERYVDEGAIVSPNAPMVSVLDIGTLVAVIHVIERDYPKIKPGLTAAITTDAFPGSTFAGRVVRIAPLIREKSREARVEIEVPNLDIRLKPGMFVRVQIDFDRRENAIVIPIAALVKRENQQGIFIVDQKEQRARFVPVTTGIINSVQAEILEPPLSGEVVTLGQHLLVDGSQIIIPGQKRAGPGKPEKTKPGEKGTRRSKSGEKS
jgi:RND family efflux transporter MFP subunit